MGVENVKIGTGSGAKKALFHSKGITYFSKKTERTIFFILTILMLLWGVLTKLGIL